MLKKPAMIFVGWPQILPKKPAAIRRHIVHRVELIAQKGGSHKADALLRNFCSHCVHVAKCRYEPVKKTTTLCRALNSAFLIGAGRWRWRPHFPHERRSMLRVCGQQPV